MTADEFRAIVEELWSTRAEAARVLGVGGGGPRVSEWCTGWRRVPPTIAASARAHHELHKCRKHQELAERS